jgi:hypothetical protein
MSIEGENGVLRGVSEPKKEEVREDGVKCIIKSFVIYIFR